VTGRRARGGRALAVLLVLSAAGGGAWLGAAPAAEALATRALRDAGFPSALVDVKRLGAGGADLTVMLDPAAQQRLGSVSLRWSAAGLLGGRLDAVELRRPRLDVSIAEDGTLAVAGVPLPGGEGPGADGPGGAGEGGIALPARRLAIAGGVLRLSTPAGTTEMPVEAEFAEGEGGPSGRASVGAPGAAGLDVTLAPRAGRAAAEAEVELRIPDLAAFLPDLRGAAEGRATLARAEGAWRGRFDLRLRDGALAGIAEGAAAELGGAFSVEGRALAVDLDGPARLSAQVAHPAIGGRAALVATGLGLRRDGEGVFSAAGALRLETEGGQGAVRFDRLSFRAADPLGTLVVEGLSGALPPFGLGGLRVAVPALRLDWRGGAGRVALEATGAGRVGGAEIERATLAYAGGAAWTARGASLRPDGCARLGAGLVRLGAAAFALPSACLKAAEGKDLLGWDPASADPWTAAAVVEAGRIDADLGGTTLVAEGGAGRFDLDPVRPTPLEAEFKARLRGAEEPAWIAPVPVALSARGEAGAVAFTARAGGALPLVVEGRLDAVSGAGSARLRRAEARFGPGGVDLAAVSPRLAGSLRGFEGSVALAGRAAWGKGAPTGRAELRLAGVGFEAGPVGVRGVDAVLVATSLAPLVLPPGQEVSIQALDLGVPLTSGLLALGYEAGSVRVDRAGWDWAGGVVRAEPFALTVPALEGEVALRAEGLDLGRLLDLVSVDGLAATGSLSGRLPVRLGPGSVEVRDGRLAAAGPGTLRYDPAEPPSFLSGGAPGTELLVGALTDFRYDSLEMALDGRAGGELAARLSIRGRNPRFYDGYPVSLNLNLSGALDTMLRRGLEAYRIPDSVMGRIREFQAGGE
jgi:hypothetical protein